MHLFRRRAPGCRGLLAAALACLMLGACGGPAPVVIGAVLPLSGPAASVGAEVRDGLRLAVDRVNAEGGLNGRPLKLVIRDGAGGASAARDAYEAVTRRDPLLTVAATSSVAMALKPRAEKRDRLLMGLVATAPALTDDTDHVYRYWPTAEQELPVMARVLPAGTGTVGVAYLDDAYGTSVFRKTRKRMADTNTDIKGIPFPIDTTRFKPLARQAVATGDGPDAGAVVVAGFQSHILGMLRALDGIGYDGLVISTTTATLPAVVRAPAADGTRVVAPAIYNPNYVFADAVRQRYEERYDKPFNQYAANGHDLVTMLTGLLENHAVNRRALHRRLHAGFVYSGVFGNVRLEKDAHDIHFPLFPARIQDKNLVYQ